MFNNFMKSVSKAMDTTTTDEFVGSNLNLGSTSYYIDKVLGEGSYSKVYLMHSNSSGKSFALKQAYVSPQNIKVQQNEIKAMQLCGSHHHCLKLVYAQARPGRGGFKDFYIVLPYCRETLFDKLKDLEICKSSFSESELIDICIQITSAVSHIHSKGIVHRDIKIENVFGFGNSHWVLGDFGSAIFETKKHFNSFEQAVKFQDNIDTYTTPTYRAPEQIQINDGDELDLTKGDVWAIGVIVYMCAFMELPFETELAAMSGKFKANRGTFSPQFHELIDMFFKMNHNIRPSCDEILAFIRKWWDSSFNPKSGFTPTIQQQTRSGTHTNPKDSKSNTYLDHHSTKKRKKKKKKKNQNPSVHQNIPNDPFDPRFQSQPATHSPTSNFDQDPFDPRFQSQPPTHSSPPTTQDPFDPRFQSQPPTHSPASNVDQDAYENQGFDPFMTPENSGNPLAQTTSGSSYDPFASESVSNEDETLDPNDPFSALSPRGNTGPPSILNITLNHSDTQTPLGPPRAILSSQIDENDIENDVFTQSQYQSIDIDPQEDSDPFDQPTPNNSFDPFTSNQAPEYSISSETKPSTQQLPNDANDYDPFFQTSTSGSASRPSEPVQADSYDPFQPSHSLAVKPNQNPSTTSHLDPESKNTHPLKAPNLQSVPAHQPTAQAPNFDIFDSFPQPSSGNQTQTQTQTAIQPLSNDQFSQMSVGTAGIGPMGQNLINPGMPLNNEQIGVQQQPMINMGMMGMQPMMPVMYSPMYYPMMQPMGMGMQPMGMGMQPMGMGMQPMGMGMQPMGMGMQPMGMGIQQPINMQPMEGAPASNTTIMNTSPTFSYNNAPDTTHTGPSNEDLAVILSSTNSGVTKPKDPNQRIGSFL